MIEQTPSEQSRAQMMKPAETAVSNVPQLAKVASFARRAGEYFGSDDTAHQIIVPDDGQDYAALLENRKRTTDITIRDGQVLLTPSGSTERIKLLNDMTGSIIRFDPTRMKEFVRSSLRVLVDEASSGQIRVVEDVDLTNLAVRMLQTAAREEIGRDVALDAMAQLFLVTLVRNHAVLSSETAISEEHLTLKQFRDLCVLVDSRLDTSIRVNDLARELGVSLSSLKRKLLADTGHTPLQFLNERRLRRALDLLNSTHRSIGEIAHTCGFSDQAHMSRAFKKRFRHSPRDHRKQIKLENL